MYYLFCVVLRIVCVYMCTVLLPPGGYPIAFNKYIYLSIYLIYIMILYLCRLYARFQHNNKFDLLLMDVIMETA